MGTDDLLARHRDLLVALNATADRQTAHLEAILEQLRLMNDRLLRVFRAREWR
jgi:hypothetical protein